MFFDKLKSYRIILASGSPRRRELLGELGLTFEVRGNHLIEEKYPSCLSQYEIPVYLAEMKAKSYPDIVPETAVLITADTIVWQNGKVADKPSDRRDAIRILGELSGSVHEVVTGVCFCSGRRLHSFFSATKVWFSTLSKEEILYYVDRYQPYDKAGAYGIQEWIGHVGIEKIEGSYSNIIGLPVQKVYRELKKFLDE